MQLLLGKIVTYQLEKRYIHKSGNLVWILVNVSLIRDAKKRPLHFIAQIQNIDTQKHAEHELKYIAYHDVLTGLYNRKQLDVSFELALSYAKRNHTSMAVMFMDLDGFKEINDQYGHDIGDYVLIEIALRLKMSVRETDILIRLGGDEFIVVLTELIDTDQATEVANKILDTIAAPIFIKQHYIIMTASIGISIYPKDDVDLKTLIKYADKALYAAKAQGKNNFKCYSLDVVKP
jgi:diguanylate cyclase (GGDEF)-like protein